MATSASLIPGRERGTFSWRTVTFPDESSQAMSRSTKVFFIQKERPASASKTNSIPSSGPRACRNINPRSLTLSLASRGSESEVFEVQPPKFAEPGTYGFTLRIKYRDTLFDKQVFVYVYKPLVETFAPPLPDQFLAWMSGSLPNIVMPLLALAIVIGVAFAFYRKMNSAAYSQERLDNLRFLWQMLDTGEKKNRKTGLGNAPIRGERGREQPRGKTGRKK